jgi:hypothetical protein
MMFLLFWPNVDDFDFFSQTRKIVLVRRDHAGQGNWKQNLERERCWRYEISQVRILMQCCKFSWLLHSSPFYIFSVVLSGFVARHKESNRIRVLMRQEKTMKVIANHFLDPRITLTPNAGNDKSWVWVCFDYSDEELVETVSSHSCLWCDLSVAGPVFMYDSSIILRLMCCVETVSFQTFAIRFASAEIAQEYKAAFLSAQKEMEKLMAGGDAAEGSAEADEAAKAIDALSVKPAEATEEAVAPAPADAEEKKEE